MAAREAAGPITIYGSGSWGTTLAVHLARAGHKVDLWAYSPEERRHLIEDRQNPFFLPGILLPESIHVISEAGVPAPSGDVAVVAVPSHGVRALVGAIPRGARATWVVATKGLEEETCLTMSQVLAEVRGPESGSRVVLAGPSLAKEVAEGKPSAVLAASTDAASRERVQHLFSTERFRVYTSGDPLGVELGTSLKNVVALAAGIADGLGLGQNTRGALLTRGLAEIRRLGEALGARPETFLGLAGVGDLVTTCTSSLSRNHTLGEALGRGRPLEAALAEIGMVVEGVRTTRAACTLSDRVGVELPIARQVARILFEGASPQEALHQLMTRPLRPE